MGLFLNLEVSATLWLTEIINLIYGYVILCTVKVEYIERSFFAVQPVSNNFSNIIAPILLLANWLGFTGLFNFLQGPPELCTGVGGLPYS